MNNNGSMQDWVFVAVVGPPGCGKTISIFKILSGNTFYTKLNNIKFLYRQMQQIHIKREQKFVVFFKKYASLDFLINLKNCLLTIDDSCDEIYNDIEFVTLATAGRH